jgi:hypothetical protein
MKLKHNRLKNTAILFELLTQKLTSEIISEQKPIAVNLIKKYFHNTELAKEYSLYESVINSTNLDETRANLTLSEIEKCYNKIDKKQLSKQKYNLISEITKIYDANDFFKARVNNYKLFGTISNILESYSNNDYDVTDIIKNKTLILEHLKSTPIIEEKSQFVDEYSKLDESQRNMVFKKVVKKFNDNFADKLNENQKSVLSDYLISISSSPKLTESFNIRINKLKQTFTKYTKKIDDQVTLVKLNEIVSELVPYSNNYIIKESDVEKLLQYYELESELNQI